MKTLHERFLGRQTKEGKKSDRISVVEKGDLFECTLSTPLQLVEGGKLSKMGMSIEGQYQHLMISTRYGYTEFCDAKIQPGQYVVVLKCLPQTHVVMFNNQRYSLSYEELCLRFQFMSKGK